MVDYGGRLLQTWPMLITYITLTANVSARSPFRLSMTRCDTGLVELSHLVWTQLSQPPKRGVDFGVDPQARSKDLLQTAISRRSPIRVPVQLLDSDWLGAKKRRRRKRLRPPGQGARAAHQWKTPGQGALSPGGTKSNHSPYHAYHLRCGPGFYSVGLPPADIGRAFARHASSASVANSQSLDSGLDHCYSDLHHQHRLHVPVPP